MDIKFQLFVAAAFVVGFVSCTDKAGSELYREVFVETEPHLDRSQVLKMLQDLKQFYQNDPETIRLIDGTLRDSEISPDRCFASVNERVTGRARQLVVETKQEQAKLCEQLWISSTGKTLAELDKEDVNAVTSITKHMVDANDGNDFIGVWFDMPYQNAQKGVLSYMEAKLGKPLPRDIKQEKFDEYLDSFVYKPCAAINKSLNQVEEFYKNFNIHYGWLVKLQNSVAYNWAKKDLICRKLRGSGYSSNDKYFTFRQDMFKNIFGRSA